MGGSANHLWMRSSAAGNGPESRASSGLPFSLFEPGWCTNWQIESYGVERTAPVKMQQHYDSTEILSSSPIRLPSTIRRMQRRQRSAYPIRAKPAAQQLPWRWLFRHRLRPRKELEPGRIRHPQVRLGSLQLTNTVRFDPASIGSGLTERQPGHSQQPANPTPAHAVRPALRLLTQPVALAKRRGIARSSGVFLFHFPV